MRAHALPRDLRVAPPAPKLPDDTTGSRTGSGSRRLPPAPGSSMSFAHVALPLPLHQTFVYAVPEALADRATPGCQVLVPFRGRAARGVVMTLDGASGVEAPQALSSVLGTPVLSEHM